jgi:hypothetical protein
MPAPIDQKRGAAELVRRARFYDQNAMAIIDEVRSNAERGDPKARSGFREIMDYIRAHPVEAPLSEGAARALGTIKDPRNTPDKVVDALGMLPGQGCKEDVLAACVLLGAGPPITDEWLTEACTHVAEWRDTFLFAVDNAGDDEALGTAMREVGPASAPYLCAGHCVGMGRKIRAALEGQPEALSEGIAWELGR